MEVACWVDHESRWIPCGSQYNMANVFCVGEYHLALRFDLEFIQRVSSEHIHDKLFRNCANILCTSSHCQQILTLCHKYSINHSLNNKLSIQISKITLHCFKYFRIPTKEVINNKIIRMSHNIPLLKPRIPLVFCQDCPHHILNPPITFIKDNCLVVWIFPSLVSMATNTPLNFLPILWYHSLKTVIISSYSEVNPSPITRLAIWEHTNILTLQNVYVVLTTKLKYGFCV